MKLKVISDGTNAGTHLFDEETGEVIHKISKITWEANAKEFVTKTTVEFTNIPVEIVSKAEVELLEFTGEDFDLVPTKTFEKEIKVTTDPGRNGLTPLTKIYDNQTQEQVGAIQEVTWEATPHNRIAKVKRIRFDNRDW